MRLARLDLTRYGKFTGGSLDFGERKPGRPDLHIVYGANEAGKSTAFSALLDLLFGIETQSDYAFLHSYKTMKIGAAFELNGAAPKVFGRIKRPQNSLLDATDQPVGDGALLAGLGGLDRTAYRNMFSLDDETLEKGGQNIIASKGDLGQLLFSASAGLAELSQTLDALRAETDKFQRGRSSGLAELKASLDRLKGERERLDTVLPTYRRLVETSEASRLQYDRALADLRDLRTRGNSIERLLQALPRNGRLLALRERLAPMSGLPHPPLRWSDELPILQREEIEIGTRIAGCDVDIATLKAARDGVPVDEPALRCAERIDELHADPRARFVTAEKDLPERRRSLVDHDAAIAKLLRRLDRDDEPDPDRLVLGASVLGALRALIEQRSGVAATLDTAQRQHADAEQALVEAKAALAGVGGVETGADAGVAPLKSLLGAARANDYPARRRQAEKARGTLLDRLAARMAALRPWTGTVEQLAAGTVPRPADLARWKQAEVDLAQAQARLDADVERLTTERLRLKAEQDTAGQFAAVVSDAEAASIRTRREQAWAAHRRDLQPDTADLFEAALRQDDLVIGARLTRDTELARLRQVGLDLARSETDLTRAAGQREALGASMGRLVEEIGDAMQALGWPKAMPQSVVELDSWLQVRAECLDLHARLRDEDRAIETADADVQDARDRLAGALAAAGSPQPAEARFADVLAVAEALVERESHLSGLRTQLGDRRSAFAKRERELTSAKAADADWTAAWERACASCWLGEGASVPTLATVREILAALADLGPWLEKRGALALRISKMEEDQAQFTRDLDRIGGELGHGLMPGSPLDRAASLVERLRAARVEAARRNELSARLIELEGRRGTLAEARTVHGQRAAAMTTLFGVASLTEVGERLEQAQDRAELATAAAEIEQEIVATLGVPSLGEAEGLLASADLAALEAERDDLKPRIEDLDQRTRHLYAEHTRASDALAGVGGDDAVARIAEQRRTVLLDIEDRALRYLRVRIGIAAAEQALRAYRDKHRSSMMGRASDAFRTISRGAYSGLAAQPGDKGDVLVALHANGSKQAEQLSKGTRFQLYLSLRVAGYYEYCLAREPVPFVADDIMETFDDFRAEEAFRLFAQMAEVGQVIYLTHHRHLCDIARTVCPEVRISELAAAA